MAANLNPNNATDNAGLTGAAECVASAAKDCCGPSNGGHTFHFHGAVTFNISNQYGAPSEFDPDYDDDDEFIDDDIIEEDDEEEAEQQRLAAAAAKPAPAKKKKKHVQPTAGK